MDEKKEIKTKGNNSVKILSGIITLLTFLIIFGSYKIYKLEKIVLGVSRTQTENIKASSEILEIIKKTKGTQVLIAPMSRTTKGLEYLVNNGTLTRQEAEEYLKSLLPLFARDDVVIIDSTLVMNEPKNASMEFPVPDKLKNTPKNKSGIDLDKIKKNANR